MLASNRGCILLTRLKNRNGSRRFLDGIPALPPGIHDTNYNVTPYL
nr:MAG TPA: hypothetical protein [Bacteriophage sp.]